MLFQLFLNLIFLLAVEPFKIEMISETVLHRLLEQDIYCSARQEEKNQGVYLYTRGKQADYFIMILQGRVEVTIGKENLIFEQGPFAFFGQHALMSLGGTDKGRPHLVSLSVRFFLRFYKLKGIVQDQC